MTPEERVLKSYFERLSAFQVEKSRVIAIEFESQNAELAARVANTIAEDYIVLQQAAKQDQTRNAGMWLAGEIESLRKKVAEAEAKVEKYRCQHQSVHRHQQHDAVEPAARRIQRPARRRSCAEVGRRSQGAAHPRGFEIGRAH